MESPYSNDIDEVEDGELSSSTDEGYTPLARPTNLIIPDAPAHKSKAESMAGIGIDALPITNCSPLASCHKMQCALEEEIEENLESNSSNNSSDSCDSSDLCNKKLPGDAIIGGGPAKRKRQKRIKRTVMVRVPATTDAATQEKRARFKKYNIWTEALQEEALTETMRGCDVARDNRCNDRNVENYDFSLHRRLEGGNCLKRRLSNSADDCSDSDQDHQFPAAKRCRSSTKDLNKAMVTNRRNANRNRFGHKSYRAQRHGSSPTSGSDNSCDPRHILDLVDIADRDSLDVAREMANKLFEEKDELLVRIVEVLGTELPMEVYKETQRIEAGGGMMIMNGARRRTPGGVFLFLLKNHERLTKEDQRKIFAEERQNTNKKRKHLKTMSRDRKVEWLKKRLSEQEKELPALSTRKDHFLLGTELNLENQIGNLSNPPPSPVGNEQTPEYKTHAINHVLPDISVELPNEVEQDQQQQKASTSTSALAVLKATDLMSSKSKEIVSYDDDFLDINCGDMDLL